MNIARNSFIIETRSNFLISKSNRKRGGKGRIMSAVLREEKKNKKKKMKKKKEHKTMKDLRTWK